MAGPLEIDSALYRMKAYSGLLLTSTTHAEKDVGQDIRVLLEWIAYARPLLGAITAEGQALNPYAQIQGRHGIQQQSQATAVPAKPADPPPVEPPKPADEPETTPENTPPPPPSQPEDKPPA